MIAPRELPESFRVWNRRHGAPNGRHNALTRRLGTRVAASVRHAGPFAWQENNSTRLYEYPWAHDQLAKIGRPLRLLEIGGSLAGLQWVLARDGHTVINVDPGDAAAGVGWNVGAAKHARISDSLRAPVELRRTTIDRAQISDDSVDVLLSISTIEHFAPADVDHFAQHASRVLQPGGRAVLTIDLFLDLHPFTSQKSNRFGSNIDVADLLECSRLKLASGNPEELNGFPEFDPDRLQTRLPRYLIGDGYPAMAQLVVAEPV